MGHSRLEKQQTHDRIVETAARRLREKGLEGIGVADLMKEAGLTVGGFYKHFASRDDMVVEAMERAFCAWEDGVRAAGKSPADVPAEAYISDYMSPRHRDDPAAGCPFAALTADLARGSEKCRAAATGRIKTNIGNLARKLDTPEQDGGTDPDVARRKAIVISCLLAGAVGISRIADDASLSDEILATVKEFAAALAAPDRYRSDEVKRIV